MIRRHLLERSTLFLIVSGSRQTWAFDRQFNLARSDKQIGAVACLTSEQCPRSVSKGFSSDNRGSAYVGRSKNADKVEAQQHVFYSYASGASQVGMSTKMAVRLVSRLVESAKLLVIRARCWFEEIASGRVQSLVEIARREGLPKRYVTRLARLAFVSPVVAEAVAAGRASAGINLQMLMDGRQALPLDWKEQQLAL